MSTLSSSDSQMSSNPMISSNSSSTAPAPQPNNQTNTSFLNKTKKFFNNRIKPGKLIKQLGKSIPDSKKKVLDSISDTYIRGSDKLTKLKNLYNPVRLGKTKANLEAERKSYKSRNALRMNTRDKKMECKKYINKVKTELNGLGNKLFTLIDTTKEDVQFDPELPELEGDISSILFIKDEYEIHQDNQLDITKDDISKDVEVKVEDRAYAEKRGLKQPYYNKISVNPAFRDLDLEEITAILSSTPEDFFYDPDDDNDDTTEEMSTSSSLSSSSSSPSSSPSSSSSSPSSVASSLSSSPSSVSPQANVTTPLLNSNPGPNPNGYGASNSTGSDAVYSDIASDIAGGGRDDDAIMAYKIIPFIKKLHDLTITQTEDNEYINAEKMADQLTQWNRLIALNKVYVNMEKNPLAGGKTRKRRKTKKRKGRK